MSRIPGGPVERVALQIGRPLCDVDDKMRNFRSIDRSGLNCALSGTARLTREVWSQFYDTEMEKLKAVAIDAGYARLWSVSQDEPACILNHSVVTNR